MPSHSRLGQARSASAKAHETGRDLIACGAGELTSHRAFVPECPVAEVGPDGAALHEPVASSGI